jgi:hypothetical protein
MYSYCIPYWHFPICHLFFQSSSPFVSGYQTEISDCVTGKPAVNARRHVHYTALNAGVPCRFNHPVKQQLRQQKMACKFMKKKKKSLIFNSNSLTKTIIIIF